MRTIEWVQAQLEQSFDMSSCAINGGSSQENDPVRVGNGLLEGGKGKSLKRRQPLLLLSF